jgi:iron(II)-dependent oxidoreductase
VDLDYGYWIGRYPVTIAQFRVFLLQSDYEIQGRFREFTEDDPPTWPARFVTWDDALAFCRWLMERARAAGWLPKGRAVTMPSEAEWEKAGRGGLKIPNRTTIARLADGLIEPVAELADNPNPRRRYPMGETLQPQQANYKAAGIGKPSAVGIFPSDVGPYGIMDLAGNVNEWTRSNYAGYPYEPEDGREDLKSRDIKVIRGGGYYDDGENWPRCSFRSRYFPHDDHVNLGFRVVVGSPFFSSDL